MNNKKLGRKNIFFERDVYFYAAMMHFLQKKKVYPFYLYNITKDFYFK